MAVGDLMPKIILAAHGRITSRHGQDVGRPFPHRGIDQGHNNMTAYDLQIAAPAAGEVVFAGLFGSYGLVIFIEHDDRWTSVLAHHSKHLVEKGDRVSRGEIIAVMGNSGTKFVHSHQELRNAKGAQVDPLKHLAATTTAGETTIPLPDPPKQRKNMALGYSTINHGKESFGLLVDGRWATVPSKALADAISVEVGRFTVLTVKDFYELRDANQPAVAAPVTVNNSADPAKIAAAVVAAFKAAL